MKLAILQSARLCDAQLQGADIRQADLSGASLLDTNLEGAFIHLADFRKAHHLKQEQIISAHGLARLPDYLNTQ
ncbi:MAG: pentapeptide repeat-containing protein [Symploca sp. SIO3C6]|uniref:Pentapeptide repeat-containing protein n=1 Tax=Symploca sp. SIO1C4 TaxID=2607765 RepID=A0A6B3NNQ9_9CYAN|nr:pentapeptide repeat-containing protein [Symploca sp. SIO3C6]NER31181.1 pentapeptide repeat-containing protein [Symploca sp. SIO1C4]